MRARFATACLALASLALCAASFAQAAPAPAWRIHSVAVPTSFEPGNGSGQDFYEVTIENSGGAPTNGNQLTLTDTLPAGLTVTSLELPLRRDENLIDEAAEFCDTGTGGGVSTVTCTIPAELPQSTPALVGPSEQLRLIIHVAVPPSATGTLVNFARIQGGGAPAAQTTSSNPVSEDPASSGFEAFEAALTDDAGRLLTQAGSHPYQYSTYFAVNTKPTPPGTPSPFVPAGGDVKDIEVQLPPGLVGNPTAAARCTAQDFNTTHGVFPKPGAFFTANNCPNGSAVGIVVVQQVEGHGGVIPLPLYNLEPPQGMPAQFGFQILGASFYIDTSVRTGSDYGISAHLRNVSEIKRVTAAAVTIWGTPAEARHDALRGDCLNQIEAMTFDSAGECPAGIAARPFLRLPTSCSTAMTQRMSFDTWTNPGVFVSQDSPMPPAINCAPLNFSPTLTARPQVSTADSPSGFRFNLHVPQVEASNTLATADLRDAVITLPPGVAVNPSSASGLAGCSPGQIELHGLNPPACPEASKVGTVEVQTPLLDHSVRGSVYVASQADNPFGSLIAIYITANDPRSGVVLKLAGKVEMDQATGQITTRFADNPQLPFEDLFVDFFDGPRAPLRTPATCGTYTTTTSLTPWSAPESGPPAAPADSFAVGAGPGGSSCPDGHTAVTLTAGLQTPIAGSYSPFSLRLTRADGTGEINAIDVSPPKGLLAKLSGIPYCPEAAIEQARGRAHPGGGAAEQAQPSCPSASRVGTITVGAGAGPTPYYTSGQAYLAGPYKGAPISLVAIVPAVAGPFDLGVVTDRIALRVDAETAQVSAQSDPFPTILQGIPLDTRDVRIALDRPDFTLAPTSCKPTQVIATAHGPGGDASATDRFQVGACKALDFAPKLSLRLKGSRTTRGGHPALNAVLQARKGDANISRTSVALPHSEFLDQSHIGTICTRVQFAAEACPKASVYGRARAFTPLLAKPLEGPVYLRSSSHTLPDLVADLQGQIGVVLVGRIDSLNGGIRTTFEGVPDAPVTKFVLSMQGGKKGLLVNSTDICRHPGHATVKIAAHNGRHYNFRPPLHNSCKASKKSAKARK
jgi:hypothetical protein